MIKKMVLFFLFILLNTFVFAYSNNDKNSSISINKKTKKTLKIKKPKIIITKKHKILIPYIYGYIPLKKIDELIYDWDKLKDIKYRKLVKIGFIQTDSNIIDLK